jgi:hypothetical protein
MGRPLLRRLAAPFIALALLTAAGLELGQAAPSKKTSARATWARLILLGIRGDAARFKMQTGQESAVMHIFLGWDQGRVWGSPLAELLASLAPIPMIHLGTSQKPPGLREAISPQAIALGGGDAYLVALNEAIAAWGKLIYIRPMAEMNNPGTLYSAIDRNGRSRGASHSPESYKKAFARIYLILHGGSAAQVSARLRALGLPPVAGDLMANPYPRLRVIWNPIAGITQGPPLQDYYPGDMYVDLVGNDMYASAIGQGSWPQNEALYMAYPGKPYALPEWGLEVDDPGFVQKMCDFIRTHRRVQLSAYYESKASSRWDLGGKPSARAVYRKCISPLGGR